jgi:hypothetical protein
MCVCVCVCAGGGEYVSLRINVLDLHSKDSKGCWEVECWAGRSPGRRKVGQSSHLSSHTWWHGVQGLLKPCFLEWKL